MINLHLLILGKRKCQIILLKAPFILQCQHMTMQRIPNVGPVLFNGCRTNVSPNNGVLNNVMSEATSPSAGHASYVKEIESMVPLAGPVKNVKKTGAKVLSAGPVNNVKKTEATILSKQSKAMVPSAGHINNVKKTEATVPSLGHVNKVKKTKIVVPSGVPIKN